MVHSLIQLAIFWTLFLVVLPIVLSTLEDRLELDAPWLEDAWCNWVGASLFFAAGALGVASCLTMALRGDGTPLPAATARRLVVAGPYRFVRNPMAIAGALQTIGVGLWLGAWTALAAAVAGALIWNYFVRPSEEADLAARFGEEYEAYSSRGALQGAFTADA